jgi:hypothetical protein
MITTEELMSITGKLIVIIGELMAIEEQTVTEE